MDDVAAALPQHIRDQAEAAVQSGRAEVDGRSDNKIHPIVGFNQLKGMVRSHPKMVQMHHPQFLDKYAAGAAVELAYATGSVDQ